MYVCMYVCFLGRKCKVFDTSNLSPRYVCMDACMNVCGTFMLQNPWPEQGVLPGQVETMLRVGFTTHLHTYIRITAALLCSYRYAYPQSPLLPARPYPSEDPYSSPLLSKQVHRPTYIHTIIYIYARA